MLLNKKKKKKVFHVIEKLNDEEGGLYNIVKNIFQFLPEIENYIITSKIKNKQILKQFDYKVYLLSNLIKKFIIFNKIKPDLIHIHGIWSPVNTIMSFYALYKKIPLIISPQGMLEPWSLNEKKIKKLIFFHLLWKFLLLSADRIIFTSKQEYRNFLKLNLNSSINYTIIPNGFNTTALLKKKKINKRKKTLLYLSRIHEKKGIQNLLEVFQEMNPKNWQLDIVGSGKKKYIEYLKSKLNPGIINEKIFFLGFKSDKEKNKNFINSDIFILPSFSENFGIVVPEAMSYGLPVITTKETPWSEIKKNNCGWWIKPDKISLKNCLSEVFQLSSKKFFYMSNNAKKNSYRYRWIKIKDEYSKLYKELIK